MGAFAVLVGTLHYMGLYVQLSASTRHSEHHLSGNAMFTEVPRDVRALGGQDVEMACSFRGAGTPSYSLEIQWWYIRNRPDWTDNQPWSTNEVSPGEGLPKDATKISVVKVAGSNISHKLRLSAVRPSDEGTYECRVIDFSDAAGARHHRARAYLQVAPQGHARYRPNGGGHHDNDFEAAREGVGVGGGGGGGGGFGVGVFEDSHGASVTGPPMGDRQNAGRQQGHGTQPPNHAQGHHAKDQGHHAQDQGPHDQDQGHQDQDQGHHAQDQGHQDQGQHAQDQGHQDQGPHAQDQGHQDQGQHARDQGHQDQGHHAQGQGQHARDKGQHAQDQSHKDQGNHALDQGTHAKDKGHAQSLGHAQGPGYAQGHHTHVQGPHAPPQGQSEAGGEQSDRAEERDVPSDCPNEPLCVP